VFTLERLVRTAPFPDDTRAELLAAAPSLPQWKRVELEELCWSFIAALFHNDVRYRQEMATLEMAKGIGTYSREEMGAIAESEVAKIAVQLTGGSSREDRQQVWEGIRKAKPPK
jgi:hypothetical protein